MQRERTQQTQPVYTLEVEKFESRFSTIDEIMAHLEARVHEHPMAEYIGTFDHLRHTLSLDTGSASEDILAARNIVFCFGITLQDVSALALRPRSIGVAELKDRFVLTFLEPPMPLANVAMEQWVNEVLKPAAEKTAASA